MPVTFAWCKIRKRSCCSFKDAFLKKKLAWPCFLGSKIKKAGGAGWGRGGTRKGGHSGRGGVTSKPTSKGINNCFCWFCFCDTDRRSSKWRAGSFDFRQPSWRGLLLSAAEQSERSPLIKVLFVLIFSFAQGVPTEREGSYRELGRSSPPGTVSFSLWKASHMCCIQAHV